MTSEAILENPAFFSPEWNHIEQVMLEYLDFAKKYNENINTARSHIYKSLYSGFKLHTDLRDQITAARTIDEFKAIVTELYERRKDEDPESKITWYQRHWKTHETEPAHIESDFEEFVGLMDKRLKPGAAETIDHTEENIGVVANLFNEGNEEDY
jgi:hypothetical protein